MHLEQKRRFVLVQRADTDAMVQCQFVTAKHVYTIYTVVISSYRATCPNMLGCCIRTNIMCDVHPDTVSWSLSHIVIIELWNDPKVI
jgi:hypothetical protein